MQSPSSTHTSQNFKVFCFWIFPQFGSVRLWQLAIQNQKGSIKGQSHLVGGARCWALTTIWSGLASCILPRRSPSNNTCTKQTTLIFVSSFEALEGWNQRSLANPSMYLLWVYPATHSARPPYEVFLHLNRLRKWVAGPKCSIPFSHFRFTEQPQSPMMEHVNLRNQWKTWKTSAVSQICKSSILLKEKQP